MKLFAKSAPQDAPFVAKSASGRSIGARVFAALFHRRIRGVRVIEAAGGACLVVLVLAVYFFKAGAGIEGAQIADTTRQITAEQQRVRLLRAELAHLESPERLEQLSTEYLGMAPVSPKKEAAPETLVTVVQSQQRAN